MNYFIADIHWLIKLMKSKVYEWIITGWFRLEYMWTKFFKIPNGWSELEKWEITWSSETISKDMFCKNEPTSVFIKSPFSR